MDNMRGQFPGYGDHETAGTDDDLNDDETGRELPPVAIGQDERRMQVRAYNFWASMLQDRNFPAIEDLDPQQQPDFGPYSVLLDFSVGIENPAIVYLGEKLAGECGGTGAVKWLEDVPSRSLLSRITDHYMQILANQAPIGFEAEFVNQQNNTVLYRGILLPFSSDDDTIDFIYGVINWKELADQQTTDELLLQIDQALEPQKEPAREVLPLTDWADGPVEESGIRDLSLPGDEAVPATDFPMPSFGGAVHEPLEIEEADHSGPLGAEEADAMGLDDWLASARELAQAAKASEDRSRQALYAAIGRAYDFSLAAQDNPEEFAEIIADAGLTVQDRAPMTPLVKLVFGIDFDKTRIAEYATVLGHAQRLELGRGTLADYLASASGGLKGIVAEERQRRRGTSHAETAGGPSEALLGRLRSLETRSFADVGPDGEEFTLLVARRLADGSVVLVGEVAGDAKLLERAGKHLLK